MTESAGRRSLPKQENTVSVTTARKPKTTSIKKMTLSLLNRRISREFRFIQLVKSVRDMPNRICNTASKIEKEILKIGRPSSRSLEYAECGHFTLLFCKKRQRIEQRIITHVYTNIVLVAVEVALNSIKLNKQQMKPCQTKRRLRVQKTSLL